MYVNKKSITKKKETRQGQPPNPRNKTTQTPTPYFPNCHHFFFSFCSYPSSLTLCLPTTVKNT